MPILVYIIITAVFTAILTIVFSGLLKPLKTYFFDRYTDRCIYPGEGGRSRNQTVIITKRFGRVVHIDCPYWQIREKIMQNNIAYTYCPHGIPIECDVEPRYKRRRCKFT